VGRLVASPSEALLLAARAHHLRRWAIARSEYPEGRVGYHQWRRALQHLHAREVAAILAAEDYDAETIARVEGLVLKRGLGREDEVQVLEDALCLVFLETQLHDLSARYDDEKIVDILRKSLRKMSAAGIAAAGEISLEQRDASMLERAVLLEQG
jgi:hypothetical protein